MGTNAFALARLRELLRRLAKADCCEAIARLVVRRPTRWALLAWGVDWLFSCFAKAKFGKAFTCFIGCIIEAASWPASIIAFARGIFAFWAQGLASAVCGQRGL